jgi:hypothetical protein
MVSLPSTNFLSSVSISVKLTGEFTLLEEPSNYSSIVSILDLLADGPSFARSERRIKPNDLTQKFRLPNVRSIS